MRCHELKPDYILYAMGAIGEPERSEIGAHLENGCETCASGIREARALAYSMGALVDGPEPPPELRGRVLAITGLREAPAPRPPAAKRLSFWTRPLPAWQGLGLAAACLALALVPAFLWRRALADAQARQASASAALAGQRRSEAGLRDRLAGIERDASLRAAPIVALELERGAPGGTVKQVLIPTGATAIVLALPSDLLGQASEAELRDSAGAVVRSLSPLPAAGADAAGLTVDTQLLPSGAYTLVLRAGDRTVARFPFRVERR